MNIALIESQLQSLIQNILKSEKLDDFIYDFLIIYDQPKATIKRLQQGANLSNIQGELAWKKKMFFKIVNDNDLDEIWAQIFANPKTLKHNPRFVILTNFINWIALDTQTLEKIDIPFLELNKHFDFFLPLAGIEKTQHINENPADVKAALKMAKLYDEIRKDNPNLVPEFLQSKSIEGQNLHDLNVFLSRLLFCFFAEDTQIFDNSQFTNALASHTHADGHDLNSYLDKLFEVLNQDEHQRQNLPTYLNAFPYVNGGLFAKTIHSPKFTRRSRQLIIECGELDWSEINPDIFGSMIQAVITPEHRGGLGMHYTSVPNIMKVIEPLFLNELQEEFKDSKFEPKRLNKLLERISKIKIFDPACGSGNFLIIAYKELRKLEIKILQQLQELQFFASGFEKPQLELIPKSQLTLAASYQKGMFSRIELSQFYGIEIDDFAHEIAILSLWLAEHQMNTQFNEIFQTQNASLPLKPSGNIVHGNATRVNWEEVCPKKTDDEIYILGNPPYLGSKRQSEEQKKDMALIYKGIEGYKNIDYIGCWFFLGKKYIENANAQIALVTTNSLNQGDSVSLLWSNIISDKIEIGFAHTSFKWNNNAKSNAAVICTIVSLRNVSNKPKFIFNLGKKTLVNNISPYLTKNTNIIVSKRTQALSQLPEMVYGNMPLEGNFLKLNENEKNNLIKKDSRSEKFIRKLIGGEEFLNGIERYALWIKDSNLEEALEINEIKERIDKVRKFRMNGGEVAKTLVSRSHQFRYTREAKNSFMIIPCTSSERREYMQAAFYTSDYITLNSAQIIYDSEPIIFSIVSSKMHMVWLRAVGGRLKSDYRYSTALCYNTFPFPELSESQKKELEKHVHRIIGEREEHSEKTLAELYDPEKMPAGLREAHHQNDLAIERIYRSKPFENDEERLEYLFKLYEQMIASESEKGTLFEGGKKKKK